MSFLSNLIMSLSLFGVGLCFSEVSLHAGEECKIDLGDYNEGPFRKTASDYFNTCWSLRESNPSIVKASFSDISLHVGEECKIDLGDYHEGPFREAAPVCYDTFWSLRESNPSIVEASIVFPEFFRTMEMRYPEDRDNTWIKLKALASGKATVEALNSVTHETRTYSIVVQP